MSMPPREPHPWMEPIELVPDEDEPIWCERCERMTAPLGCPACDDEDDEPRPMDVWG